MEELTKRIYVETRYPGTNVGLIVSERGLVMVDSPYMPKDALDFRKQIQEIGGGEVIYLINTDHHGDHVACGGFFTQNIVLQERSLDPLEVSRLMTIERTGQVLEDEDASTELKDTIRLMELPRPHIVFSDRISFNMGDLTIQVVHTGGHTVGTSYVFVPEEKAVFCGDNVVSGRFPYMGQGTYRTWANALKQILALDAEMIIPGHETPCDKETVQQLLKFMEDLEASAWQLFNGIHREHMPPKRADELAAFFPGIAGWPKPAEEAMALVVRRMYEQLTGQALSL